MCNIIDFFFFSAKRKIIRREGGNPYTARTTQREKSTNVLIIDIILSFG